MPDRPNQKPGMYPFSETCLQPKTACDLVSLDLGFSDIHHTCFFHSSLGSPCTTIGPHISLCTTHPIQQIAQMTLLDSHSFRHTFLSQVAARSHNTAGQGGAAGKNHSSPWQWNDSTPSSLHHGDSKVNADKEVAAKRHTLF